MARVVDYNRFDIDTLIEFEETGKIEGKFQKKKKCKRFDDGTYASKPAKKKENKHVVNEDND